MVMCCCCLHLLFASSKRNRKSPGNSKIEHMFMKLPSYKPKSSWCCSKPPLPYLKVTVYLHPEDLTYVGKRGKKLIHGKVLFAQQKDKFEILVNEEDDTSPTRCSVTFLPSGDVFYPLTVNQALVWTEAIQKTVSGQAQQPQVKRYAGSKAIVKVLDALDSSPTAKVMVTKAVAVGATAVVGGAAVIAAPVVLAVVTHEARRLAT